MLAARKGNDSQLDVLAYVFVDWLVGRGGYG
jgi:hypothetical protein